MPLNTVIVEDEALSRIFLQNLLTEFFPQINVVAAVSSEDHAVEAIRRLQPDMVFLDIELQQGTGFEVLKRIEAPYPLIVFITAYDHYAIKPIQFSGIDYLLKPVDVDGLQQVIQNTCAKKESGATQTAVQHLLHTLQNGNRPEQLSLCTPGGLEFIRIKDIIRIESNNNESHFILRCGGTKITNRSIQEFDALLKDHAFLRIHQCHIVNVREIQKAEGFSIRMNDNSQVPVSPKKKEELYQALIH